MKRLNLKQPLTLCLVGLVLLILSFVAFKIGTSCIANDCSPPIVTASGITVVNDTVRVNGGWITVSSILTAAGVVIVIVGLVQTIRRRGMAKDKK